jgi:hypothetical protein
MICADFSTILSINRNHRASILADLRRIYDGHLRKEFGTADNPQLREWRGRITFLVAATPDVDRHYGVFQSLGERFVMVRWARPGGTEAAMWAMNQDTAAAKSELNRAVQRLIRSLRKVSPQLTQCLRTKLACLSELVVRARTQVPRDGRSKQILSAPEAESATRLAQQLAQLAKGSASIAGRDTVTEEDYAIALRAGLDSVPPIRRKIIDVLAGGRPLTAIQPPLSPSTLSYAVEDLEALELLCNNTLSPLAEQLLRGAGIV